MFISNLFRYFPENISKIIDEFFNESGQNLYITLEEIRMRNSKPLLLKFSQSEKIFDYNVRPEDIGETLRIICENSIYSYQNQICSGYITVKGGHRVRSNWKCSYRRRENCKHKLYIEY